MLTYESQAVKDADKERVAPSEEVSAMRAEQAQRAGFGRKNGRGEVGGTEMGSNPVARVLEADTGDVAA